MVRVLRQTSFTSGLDYLRVKLAKSIVLCQLVAFKNFGPFSECNCFMHNRSVFFYMSTAHDGFRHFAEF